MVEENSNVDPISDRAVKIAEANVYSLNNPYLTVPQKIQVEMWYQLPFEVATLAYLVASMLYQLYEVPIYYLLVVPIVADFITGIFLWYLYSQKFVLFAYATFCGKWFLWIATGVVAGYLIWYDKYLLASLALAVKIALNILFGAHMFFFARQASRTYGMNPKYAFFKKYYGIIFPFES